MPHENQSGTWALDGCTAAATEPWVCSNGYHPEIETTPPSGLEYDRPATTAMAPPCEKPPNTTLGDCRLIHRLESWVSQDMDGSGDVKEKGVQLQCWESCLRAGCDARGHTLALRGGSATKR